MSIIIMLNAKLKLFIENFLVYGVGGIISKVVPLLMLPIITRLMPNTEYFGIYDLSNTLISFAVYFCILGMYDAMYRMFFEKDDEEYKVKICSTSFIFNLVVSLIVLILMIIFSNQISELFFTNKKLAYLVYLCAIATFVGGTNSIISAPTRFQNKRKIFLITNTLSPIIAYSISIPLLFKGYYIIALPLAFLISNLFLEISFWCLNRKWFLFKQFDFLLLKELLVIAIPLFPNFLVYWIFNSCDRVMITNLIGIENSGIYAVGSKLGMCSQLIYMAFAGGWQYFAFSTMKDANQVKNNSLVFEYLGVLSYISTLFVCAFSYYIFTVLFPAEYIDGFIIAPYLFLSPLLLMLFQVIANQFLVVKKTWLNLPILSAGAITNVVLNFLLIPNYGIEGAAISTLVGYILSDIICCIVLYKMKLFISSIKFIFLSFVFIIAFVLWRLCFATNLLFSTIIVISVLFIYLLSYSNDLRILILKKSNE